MGNPNHDEKGKFATGQTSTGVTNTVRERQALRAMVDRRRLGIDAKGNHQPGRTSNRNLDPTPSMATRFARHQARGGQGGGGGGGGGGGQSGGSGGRFGGGGTPAHQKGIHNATRDKNLADASATPTQQTEKRPTQFADTANAKPARR
jgi:hypothetical protein